MIKWCSRGVLLAGLVMLSIWAWQRFFPGPEQAIRKQLTALARAATVAPNEAPLTRIANAQRLASHFTGDAEIAVDLPGRSATLSGKDDVLQAALAARNTLSSLRVQFVDITVAVAGDRRTAVAQLTAKADFPGETVPEVEELKVSLRKDDGQWLINRVETVSTLR